MMTNSKNWHNLLWLTSFLVTALAWANLESYALAQSSGTLTVNTGELIVSEDTIPMNLEIVPSALSTVFYNADPSFLTITRRENISIDDIFLRIVNSIPGSSPTIINTGSTPVTTFDSGPITNAGNAGNIVISATTLTISRVPEGSSLLGLLTFTVVSGALVYKCKRKSYNEDLEITINR